MLKITEINCYKMFITTHNLLIFVDRGTIAIEKY